MKMSLTSSLRRLLVTYRRASSFRTYLSDAYRCEQAWQNRLKSPLLTRLNQDELYHSIEQKLNQEDFISGVDVDIFTASVQDETHLDEVEDLVFKLRQSGQAGNLFPSTGHNFVQLLHFTGRTNDLLRILHDRLNYGIFVDYHISNLIVDDFLKAEKLPEAAKVAVLHGLQEDTGNHITNNLSLLACLQNVLKQVTWELELPPPEEEPKEEVKIRVNFLRNPSFDGHFDLVKGNALMGKTMAILAPALKDKVLAGSLELLGWALFEDWKKVEKSAGSLNGPIFREAIDLIEKHISGLEKEKVPEATVAVLKQVKTKEGNLLEQMEGSVKEAVTENEAKDIQEQEKKYVEWEEHRQRMLAKQLREIEIKQKLEQIEEKKKYMKEREELLSFFEKEDQYNLIIEEAEKEEGERKLTERTVAVVEETYVPPEVEKRHVTKKKI
ncbi:uncharacterized protein LOC132205487 [Neocloeon triangulifer]|uniref:uncharacterized protein LOC132205487 n=1 Tax=Neocloeon triangulifer TaxID=2078957 RepID=UPI00286EE269|nr:uncharacterized protein LOC132205487 [Neocloeon triangulifer]